MRSYSAVVSPFDDGSQVQGLAWSALRSRWVAVALAGGGTFLGNNGNNQQCNSTNGTTWTSAGTGTSYPFSPSDLGDVIDSIGFAEWLMAGRIDVPFIYGEWLSVLGSNWSRILRGTTATFECSICVIEGGPSAANTIVGGQLESGTGRLIGQCIGGVSPFTAISTPIDNQFFRVTQIAAHPTSSFLVASLQPVGAVSVTERLMTSSDGGATWTLRAAGLLTSDAAYGVCWNPALGQWLATGTFGFVTSTNGTTWTNHVAGVDTQGKPCAAGAVTVIPGGAGANALSEWDGVTLSSTNLTGILSAKVAGYSSTLDQVVVGGLGNPDKALWVGVTPVAALVPNLNARFDLG